MNHYYSTNPNPIPGWKHEGIEGYVFESQYPGSIALYHWWSPGTGDNFYTTDPAGELAPSGDYEKQGDTVYVFGTAVPGTVPFYRWVSGTQPFCAKMYGKQQPPDKILWRKR
jgi:hypothetical protein